MILLHSSASKLLLSALSGKPEDQHCCQNSNTEEIVTQFLNKREKCYDTNLEYRSWEISDLCLLVRLGLLFLRDNSTETSGVCDHHIELCWGFLYSISHGNWSIKCILPLVLKIHEEELYSLDIDIIWENLQKKKF